LCGRFRPEICTAYLQAATTGSPTPEIVALLRRSSPATVAGNITAPTLLIQGERDTLFGLDQADATARQLASAGAPLKVVWYAGGHDGGESGAAMQERTGAWFDYHLHRIGEDPGTGFDSRCRDSSAPGEPSPSGPSPPRPIRGSTAFPCNAVSWRCTACRNQ
jgi:ABC-2 type transport system ATP-binding protein